MSEAMWGNKKFDDLNKEEIDLIDDLEHTHILARLKRRDNFWNGYVRYINECDKIIGKMRKIGLL